MKRSLNPNKSVQRHLSPLFKHSFFSLSSSLSKISEPPSQNQQNDKHSVDYHPCSSRLASRIHPFNISVNYLARYLSIMFVEFTLHMPSFLKKVFTHALFSYLKFSSKFLSSHSRQRKIIYSTRQRFFENLFSPTKESVGENYDLLY